MGKHKKYNQLGLIADSLSLRQLESLCNQLDLLEINYQNLNKSLSSSSSDEVLNEEAVRFLQEDEERFVLALSLSGNSFQIKINQRTDNPSAASIRNLNHLVEAIQENQDIRLFDYSSSINQKQLLEIALFLTSTRGSLSG